MYKYIDVLSIAFFLMSLYILYANWSTRKNKKNTILMLTLIIIVGCKSICILGNSNFFDIMSLSYISKIIISLFIIKINLNISKKKSTSYIAYINCILSIVCIFMAFTKEQNSNDALVICCMLITTIFLFTVYTATNKRKEFSKLIIAMNIGYVLISLLIQGQYNLISIEPILDCISSIYIFVKILRLYIINIDKKMEDIISQLSKSEIDIKEYKDNLKINKNISKVIGSNLEKKQSILDSILNECNRCVLLIDHTGFILNENDGLSKMWPEYENINRKITLDEFVEKSIKDNIEFRSGIIDVNNTGEEVEKEIEGKDGRYFNCTYAKFNLGDNNLGIICIVTDITYRKTSEIRIEENNTKYKKIVDNIPYSILMTNSNDILYNNEKNAEVDFNSDDIKNVILKTSTNGELYYTCKSLMQVCLYINRVSFIEDQEDRDLIVIRDISKYKDLLKKIEISKKRYEALVNIIPEGIYIQNFENKLLTYANSTFLDMVGLDSIEDIRLEDKNEIMVIPNKNMCENLNFKRKIVKNRAGKDAHIEYGSMIIDVNKSLKTIGIVRDITDQVKAELMEIEIEEKNRANKIKAEFFINMSHELKTPLNLICSSNQLIESLYKQDIKDNPDIEIAQVTTIVKKHSYILRGLIDNIMDLAKLESDFRETEKDYYNIVPIIEDVAIEFNKYIALNNMDIVFDTDEEEIIANVDPDDIEGIVLTLLSVVVRYSLPSSTIYVDLESRKNKTNISIKNIAGYDGIRYLSDKDRRNLDIGIMVSKLMIKLYGGNIDIKIENKDSIEVKVSIQCDENIKEYADRVNNRADDFMYAEYTRMCNF
ncbi:PAS domain-containing sensor histidine kinase [Romboutsia weinsteinii]|uniref:histidine kinase n=1 Tax=Romboutsia weinsteinii TaxID=2020949 RepID=A0A371J7J7_9FIRM|nr:histidine kinase dimerization/phospho-acceptor domain-containing protein [Romboutsia weinsteinii]RDY28760.1 PAS domain-containing sensor histidine kinase [Romboutsia weinsteinii]